MQSVLEVLNKCANYFALKNIPDAKLDAQLLLAHALGCKRLELFLRFEEPIPEKTLSVFREYARRRIKREPIQHILGNVDFFGLNLKCDARALVPRPETEELCELICQKLFTDSTAALKILDLGTGSGAIALALASHFKNAKVIAVDASTQALALARENQQHLNINIDILESDWFANVSDKDFDLIVSNPPYIPESDFAQLQPEVRDFDPKSALISADSGLSDLNKIITHSPKFLKSGGFLACECGLTQPQTLCAQAQTLGYSSAEAVFDLSKRPRFLICKL